MDDLFAQYCMLIITAFTPFFFFFLVRFCSRFASSWDGEGLCVCIGGRGLKSNYPKLFNVLLFFFFFRFYYTILSSDLRPPFGPTASWRLQVFCTLWWMLNRCFYYTKAECHFSFVVFCHSFQFPSDITTFSPKSENIPFWSFSKKGPKCCTLHMKVLSHRREVLPEREWMTEKKKEE